MAKPPSPESLKALRETLEKQEDRIKELEALASVPLQLSEPFESLPLRMGLLISELDRVLGFSPGTLKASITERICAAPPSSPAESRTPQSLPA